MKVAKCPLLFTEQIWEVGEKKGSRMEGMKQG